MNIIQAVRDMKTNVLAIASEVTTDKADRANLLAKADTIDQVLQLLEHDPLLRVAPFARVEVLVNDLYGDVAMAFASGSAEDLVKHMLQRHLLAALALHQRVFDLLRQLRSELLRDNLISREEYGWLAAEAAYFEVGDPDRPGQGSLGPRRLETYDDHENRMKVMRTRVARVIATCQVCGPYPDKPVCKTCQDLRAIIKDAIGKNRMEDQAMQLLQDRTKHWEANARLHPDDDDSPVAHRARAKGEAYRDAVRIVTQGGE